MSPFELFKIRLFALKVLVALVAVIVPDPEVVNLMFPPELSMAAFIIIEPLVGLVIINCKIPNGSILAWLKFNKLELLVKLAL